MTPFDPHRRVTPRENPHLFGNAGAARLLRDAADSGRLHHAWLVTGSAGVGKATLAYRFARALLAGFPQAGLALDPDHPVFRRVAAGSHPDLLTIQRGYDDKKRALKSEIVVDDARTLGGFLSLTAAMGGWRVVIVDGADHLNRSAANAVLKLLEEPPSRTILLLTATSLGRLLPTIRSRCRRLPLGPISEDDARCALRNVDPSFTRDEIEALIDLGGSAPGAALAWSGEGLVALAAAANAVVAKAGATKAGATKAGASGRVGQDRVDDDAQVDLVSKIEGGPARFTEALRRAIVRRAREAISGDGPDGVGDVARLCETWSTLDAIEREASRFNLDRRYAILAAIQTASRQ